MNTWRGFTVMWCGFVNMWCRFIIMWCGFTIMWCCFGHYVVSPLCDVVSSLYGPVSSWCHFFVACCGFFIMRYGFVIGCVYIPSSRAVLKVLGTRESKIRIQNKRDLSHDNINKTPECMTLITKTSFHIMICLDTTTFVWLNVFSLTLMTPKIWVKPLFKKAKNIHFRTLYTRHATSWNIKRPRRQLKLKITIWEI